jgi:peptidoglycan/LPS O-acetylase OafA/YrhL
MKHETHDRLRYSAALDGVRALAIAAVLIVHAYPKILIGGLTGVDVFFVISGYLITAITLHDLRAGSFSLAEFYLRRVQRLLPNLALTVLAVILMWGYLLPPGMASELGRHGLWALFNLSNLYCWRSLGGYWGNRAEWAPLTHTWSLGIEEQFYLWFPAGLMVLHRFQPSRVLPLLSVGALGSLALCLYATTRHSTASFYLLPTRGWELLFGAILAAFQSRYSPKDALLRLTRGKLLIEGAGWLGLGLIVTRYVLIDGDTGFPGIKALPPTIGTLLLVFSIVNADTRVTKLFSLPAMVLVGRQSYSIYLWHWPFMIMGKLQAELHGFSHHVGAIAGGKCGLLLAWLAYVWVEQPLRNRGPSRSRRLAAIAGGISTAAAICLIAIQQTNVDRYDRFDTITAHGKIYNAGRDTTAVRGVAFTDVSFPPVEARTEPPWRTGGIVHRYGATSPTMVVLGSSHATMYSRLIDDICRDRGVSVAFLV